ncbi:MAG: ferredoxin [Nanoarchaeota archaeon]|nr:ferredoxin [Nanoarchaeota archaeon]
MGEKKKYTIVYDRPSCIGAAACEAVDSLRWKIADSDGKADLIGGIEKGEEPGTFILEFDEDDLEKVKESAEVCPVNVIHIYDSDGNKII